MAKYHGMIGFALIETDEGSVTREKTVEKPYFGDLLKISMNRQSSDQLIDDIRLNHDIKIVGNDFAFSNFGLIRYATLRGVRWRVTSATLTYPTITLTMGGVYNGPTPDETP